MKMVKKLVAGILMSCMAFTLSVPAFAAEDVAMQGAETGDVAVVTDSTQLVDMIGVEPRGADKPTKMWNLAGNDYEVYGTYDTTIYTEYCFYPDADGNIYYDVTFTWQEPRGVAVAAGVEWIDKTTGKQVTDMSYPLPENNDGSYGPSVSTGLRKVYGLNPTHQYYARFTKAFDGVIAVVEGTISYENLD